MKFKLWLENNANQDIIKNAFSKGINKSDPSFLGYHGTSLQTLMFAIDHGYLPVTVGTERLHAGEHQTSQMAYGPTFQDYGLHIVPNPLNKIVQSIPFRSDLSENPYEDAIFWAKSIAERHSFFDKYSMDWSDPKHHEAASLFSWGTETPEYIQKKFKLAKPKRKYLQGGVVLAISDTVANEFRIAMGGDGNDINIITKALPVKYIVGIEPQNDDAYEWLDSLT